MLLASFVTLFSAVSSWYGMLLIPVLFKNGRCIKICVFAVYFPSIVAADMR